MRDHTSWAPCGIEIKIRGILKSWFWISRHEGTLSILCSRIQSYILSLMNKVDPCLLFSLCVLYEMQNKISQQTVTPLSLYLSITHRLNTIELLPLQSCTEVRGQNLMNNSYIAGHTWYWHDCRVPRDENKQCKNLARLNSHSIKIIKISNRTRQLMV